MLDDVAGVDVVVATGLVLSAHHEEHAGLPARVHDGAHRGDVVRPLGLEALGELVEQLLFQRCSREAADRFAKPWTQAIDVEPCDLRRGDDRAFGDGRLLIGRGLRRGDQQGGEESKCTHALAESKE